MKVAGGDGRCRQNGHIRGTVGTNVIIPMYIHTAAGLGTEKDRYFWGMSSSVLQRLTAVGL